MIGLHRGTAKAVGQIVYAKAPLTANDVADHHAANGLVGERDYYHKLSFSGGIEIEAPVWVWRPRGGRHRSSIGASQPLLDPKRVWGGGAALSPYLAPSDRSARLLGGWGGSCVSFYEWPQHRRTPSSYPVYGRRLLHRVRSFNIACFSFLATRPVQGRWSMNWVLLAF